jgi:hypothetical protein
VTAVTGKAGEITEIVRGKQETDENAETTGANTSEGTGIGAP